MNAAQKLIREHNLTWEEFAELIKMADDPQVDALLAEEAVRIRKEVYGTDVYTRGLIEFTNYCKNDCYYCGIRRSNPNAKRYRLTEEEILACCENGYELGFRTFVLQGGEDPYFNDDRMVDIVRKIRAGYPDCAITLSIGEKSYVINVSGKRAQIVICFVMRLPMMYITGNCIRKRCVWRHVSSVYTI